MTVLEELMDVALRVCESGRQAGQRHHSRGAALLSGAGKVYTGCDVYFGLDSGGLAANNFGSGNGGSNGNGNGISAERAAVLAAVSDGVKHFHVRVQRISLSRIYLVLNLYVVLMTRATCGQALVIASDSMKLFPTPDGQSREFLRTFGVFPVILVNSQLDCKLVHICCC